MSNSYIPAELRRVVANRANGICEYCLIHEEDSYFGCQIDHIISVKHGGPTTSENLTYACPTCNRKKGSDIGSIIWRTGGFVRFFNPRTDHWGEHFELDGVEIVALTDIGEATIRILDMNNTERLLEREELFQMGRYPPPVALHLLT